MGEWKVWYQPNAKFGRRHFSGTLSVRPGEEREALFLDRRMLGWSGILGGNDRLREELREALLP